MPKTKKMRKFFLLYIIHIICDIAALLLDRSTVGFFVCFARKIKALRKQIKKGGVPIKFSCFSASGEVPKFLFSDSLRWMPHSLDHRTFFQPKKQEPNK